MWCGACMKKSNEKFDSIYLDGIKRLSNLKMLPYLKLKYFSKVINVEVFQEAFCALQLLALIEWLIVLTQINILFLNIPFRKLL